MSNKTVESSRDVKKGAREGVVVVQAGQVTNLKPRLVDVEVDILRGLHAFTIVGLAGKAVAESRDRVSAAIKNGGFDSPKKKNQKVVVSLAPADLKKEGPVFDLAIALAYLRTVGDAEFDPKDTLFLGELALSGELRPIKGVLPLVLHAKEQGIKEIFVPKENVKEAALVDEIQVYGAKSLKEVIRHLDKRDNFALPVAPHTEATNEKKVAQFDFKDIKGQETAKRGLEIAAAGGHNIAMFGPPGAGKTMLARALPGILPSLDFNEALEVTGIHSAAGTQTGDTVLVSAAPFRTPHHTSSYAAVLGGGQSFLQPGEVTLAHRGVLFLDEFPEFSRRVIEALRQPLEDSVVSISRAAGRAEFPADFMLVAAMNPCPCGKFGSDKDCDCTPRQLQNYQKKLSGPIIDRIDIWIEVKAVEHRKLSNADGETSASARARVESARNRQAERFSDSSERTNANMSASTLKKYAPLSDKLTRLLEQSARHLDLSARGYHRTIKIARTIADLDGADKIKEEHLLEALQYRPRTQNF